MNIRIWKILEPEQYQIALDAVERRGFPRANYDIVERPKDGKLIFRLAGKAEEVNAVWAEIREG
jgi:hypothetical protein